MFSNAKSREQGGWSKEQNGKLEIWKSTAGRTKGEIEIGSLSHLTLPSPRGAEGI
jgi:hypothetical protein